MSDNQQPTDRGHAANLGLMEEEDSDRENRPLETQHYWRNMSQATLPPEYLSDAGPQEDDHPMPGRSTSEGRRESGDDDIRHNTHTHRLALPELRLQTSDNIVPLGRQSAGLTPASTATRSHLPSSRSEQDPADMLNGETLVQRRMDGNHKLSRTAGYPEEHGEMRHEGFTHADSHRRGFGGTPHTRRSSVDSIGVPPSAADTDGDSEPDEFYDWSDEEDLVDQEAHFEAKLQPSSARKKTWGARRVFVWFFSTLIGTTIVTCLLVAVPIVLRYVYYLPHKTPHRSIITRNVSAWFYWAAANLLISWHLAMILNVLPHVITWFVSTFWGTITESFKTNLGLYAAFKGWIKPILYAIGAWVSWVIIFVHIYHLHRPGKDVKSDAAYTDRMSQVIVFLFFIVLLVSLSKTLMQVIVFTFHRVAYQDRLDEVNKALAVIDHLKDYRPKRHIPGTPKGLKSGRITPTFVFGRSTGKRTPPFGPAGAPRSGTPDLSFEADVEDLGYITGSDTEKVKRKMFLGLGTTRKSKIAPRRMPTSPTKRAPGANSAGPSRNVSDDFDNVVRNQSNQHSHTYPPIAPPGARQSPTLADDAPEAKVLAQAAKVLKAAALHDARNIKGKDTTEADVSFTITSPHEAKKLARNLYFAFRADKKRTYLIPSDFYPAYPNVEDAKEAFRIFDKDNNENITRAEIKTTIMKVYKERRFLAKSLRDVSEALSTLDLILLLFAAAILFFISLSVFDVNVGKSLTSVYTLGIAASFIFKNAASTAFDAIIFLFVTHPYDSGDRCFIDNENMIVKKMGLFATTFTRVDGTSTYFYNSQLFSKFIINARRSEKTAENLTMQVDWRTPLEKIDALEKALNHWIDVDENRWFSGSTSIMLQHIDFQRSLELTIAIPHNQNWQDWGGRLNRKTAFHAAVNHYCREIGINWANSPQPIFITSYDSKNPPAADELEVGDDAGDDLSPNPVSPGGIDPAVPSNQPTMFFTPPKDDTRAGLRRRRKGNAGRANF